MLWTALEPQVAGPDSVTWHCTGAGPPVTIKMSDPMLYLNFCWWAKRRVIHLHDGFGSLTAHQIICFHNQTGLQENLLILTGERELNVHKEALINARMLSTGQYLLADQQRDTQTIF